MHTIGRSVGDFGKVKFLFCEGRFEIYMWVIYRLPAKRFAVLDARVREEMEFYERPSWVDRPAHVR